MCGRANRPDIWTQAIWSKHCKTPCEEGAVHICEEGAVHIWSYRRSLQLPKVSAIHGHPTTRSTSGAYVMARAVREIGEVLLVQIVDRQGHTKVIGLDGHDCFAFQLRRMTMAEPVIGLAQPRLAVTSMSFTCRQPPSR